MADPTATALVVAVPEAETAVGELRLRLDDNAAHGVPAHVTVLSPFLPAAEVDATVLDRLAAVCAGTAPFAYHFDRTAWFDQQVLWLAPRQPAPFAALTERVVSAFPGYPPFEGLFAEVVPHLTVGHGVPVALLRAAEQEVEPALPVVGTAQSVTLLRRSVSSGTWSVAAVLPLGRVHQVAG